MEGVFFDKIARFKIENKSEQSNRKGICGWNKNFIIDHLYVTLVKKRDLNKQFFTLKYSELDS